MSPFDRVRAALANVVAFQNGSEDALAAFAEIERELERERMRLAACGVVAMCDTPESASQARDMHPEYFSASCGDVGSVGGGEMRAKICLRETLRQVSHNVHGRGR